ncbi:hypothetical protein QR680_000730 [Steinernema hermaphroditum]|uniref:MYND-type domain-containing protein n=1 Tax=Steinernema hermaphroditum TaxID=289476 RepID=A0AA39LEL8_9BILA|nr:hypothetical protein QR680_000730 [Steinernema hermaphroditum]
MEPEITSTQDNQSKNAHFINGLTPRSRLFLQNHQAWLEQRMAEDFKGDMLEYEQIIRAKMERKLEKKRQKIIAFVRSDLEGQLDSLKATLDAIVADAKKYQWCDHCGKLAILNCCYNFSYCSGTCRLLDWYKHLEICDKYPRIEVKNEGESEKRV